MRKQQSDQWLLLIAVLIIATCGLIYELVAGTLASYLLGDSITQFSTIIGAYLFSMGIGSFLSKYFNRSLIYWFIKIELLIGFIGGFSSAILFVVFPLASSFRIVLYLLVILTGTFVGLEIPLLMRILNNKLEFKEMVSRVFSFDYLGALVASIVFPLLLVPHLGLIKTSLFFGMLNIGIGWYLAHTFSKELKNAVALKITAVIILLMQLTAFVCSEFIMNYSESMTYNDQVIYSTSSPYQRIAITSNRRETRLFLNGNLQFSTADEYRYHEALVHPALSIIPDLKSVLVLGGGDGLAVREILKYPSVQKITLVDLDKKMTQLFSTQEMLVRLNKSSLLNPKVEIHNADAFVWLRENKTKFDAIIIDFPDPSNFSIGKLYSTLFYKLLRNAMNSQTIAVIQSTSPYVAPKSYWCIDSTLHYAGFRTIPYHNYVPSFGEWGYIMAKLSDFDNTIQSFPVGLRYLNKEVLQQMLNFPNDMLAHQKILPNKINDQTLVAYFEEEWDKYQEQ